MAMSRSAGPQRQLRVQRRSGQQGEAAVASGSRSKLRLFFDDPTDTPSDGNSGGSRAAGSVERTAEGAEMGRSRRGSYRPEISQPHASLLKPSQLSAASGEAAATAASGGAAATAAAGDEEEAAARGDGSAFGASELQSAYHDATEEDKAISAEIASLKTLVDVETLLMRRGRNFRSLHVVQLLAVLPTVQVEGSNSAARLSRIVG